MTGSLVFVHGTGVRLKAYETNFKLVADQLQDAKIGRTIVECAWGDPLGSTFEGESLPDAPDTATGERQAQELARWSWLFDDPLAELEMLSIRAAPGTLRAAPGQKPRWMTRLDAIKAYAPSEELHLLLQRGNVEDLWRAAFERIVGAPIVRQAFQRSEEANELADAGLALTRAVVAQIHADTLDEDRTPPSAIIRQRLVERLCKDWDCNVFALGSLLAGLGKRIGTQVMRRRRNEFNNSIAGFVGDILLYQSRGNEIREYIATKIRSAESPVAVVAHSLGGIACVDLLATEQFCNVDRLVTLGSQAPFFYEVDALTSIRRPTALPDFFPRWLNIYDRSDFLSFVGGRLFPDRIDDEEIPSNDAFPEAHSAYLGSKAVWERVARFLTT